MSIVHPLFPTNSPCAACRRPALCRAAQRGSIAAGRDDAAGAAGRFKGMSSALLAVPARLPKLLVLSARDHLDTPLMVGQMQALLPLRGGFT